ncbi:hypothetical protein [Sphingomonas sp. PB4P5]|uniref:hypothetical protein n=1 Tax=Parasphingomonas puruogangriensis TaxID=3096155 RepID=UPI002FC76814
MIPADAIKITAKRHRDMIAGQGSGRSILVNASGKPELSPIRKPTREQLLRVAIGDIKAEASRRILAVASLEQQANDNAAMAIAALAGEATPEAAAARLRRLAIDAIRAASNVLEATIASWSAGALSNFNAGAEAHWPAKD